MIELGKILTTLPEEHQRFLKYNIFELYLPTETYIEEPQIVMPRVARAFTTNLYIVEDKFLTYDELREIEGFRGTRDYKRLLLLEIWSNQGSDGHIHHQFLGWTFISEENFDPFNRKYPLDLACEIEMNNHFS